MDNAAAPTLTARQRDIITDLLEKWPKGPKGRYEKGHYRTVFQYVPAYERHMDFALLDPSKFPGWWPEQEHTGFWGWDPKELFALSQVGGGDPYRALVRLHEPGLSGQAATKRSRRLQSRLETAVSHVRREGMPGIWECRSWDSPWGSVWRSLPVWAETAADAEARVRVAGPMLGLQENWKLEFKFDRAGTPEEAAKELLVLINGKVNERAADVKSLESRLNRARAQLAEEEARAAQLVGGAMLLAGVSEEAE
jgi:hypothetical protein